MKIKNLFNLTKNNISPLSELCHVNDLSNNVSTIHVILEVENEKLSKKELFKLCKKKLLCYHQFNSYIDSETLTWVQCDVNLNDHVKEKKLNIKNASVNCAIEKAISKQLSKPFHKKKPPWKIFSFYHDSPGPNYIVFKLSHALSDGKVLTAIISSFCDDEATVHSLKTTPRKYKKNLDYIACILLIIILFSCIKLSFGYVIIAFIAYLIHKNIYTLNILKNIICGTESTCLRCKRELLGNSKQFAHGSSISIETIKTIARKMQEKNHTTVKLTVNDIIMSLIGGGIIKYNLLKKHKKIPEQGYFTSVSALARNNKTNKELLLDYLNKKQENLFAFFIIPVCLDKTLSLKDRICKTQENLLKYKEKSCESILTGIIIKLLSVFNCIETTVDITNYFTNYVTDSYISNVIAPNNELTLSGRKVSRVYHCTSPLSFGITFSILSYNKNITVSCSSDKNHVNDPHVLLNYIYEEYQELYKLYM